MLKITWQVPTRGCLLKVAFTKHQLEIIQRSFRLSANFLLTLILQSLKSHFFVNITLHMEIAINITLSQSSMVITCFNQVTHKHSSKKVKGVLAV